jgi:hypothetical protein
LSPVVLIFILDTSISGRIEIRSERFIKDQGLRHPPQVNIDYTVRIIAYSISISITTIFDNHFLLVLKYTVIIMTARQHHDHHHHDTMTTAIVLGRRTQKSKYLLLLLFL